MNAKIQSTARLAIPSAQSIPVITPPAWQWWANRTALALALAAAFVPLATQAAKPPKPPPAPTSPAYVSVVLGGLRDSGGQIVCSVGDLNNAGQVVGYTAIPGLSSGTYSQGFLINPRDANGDGTPDTWFLDADSDGLNDLIIPLGTLPACAGCGRHCFASAINDLGWVVGISAGYDFTTKVGTQKVFILVPKDNSWYQDSNGDGFNDLMLPLGRPQGVPDTWNPTDLNINKLGQVIGWFCDPNGLSPSVGFVLTPEKDSNGFLQWFRDDGRGANDLMLNLGDFIPKSVNDQGQIAGITAVRTAILRNSDGSLIPLNPGGTVSEAIAINNRGQIGVWWQVNGVGHAGLLTPLDTYSDGAPDTWDRDANGDGVNDLIVDLGNVKGLENSYLRPQTLNDAGSVAGGSWHAGRDGLGWNRAAFLWQNGVLQSLKTLTGGTIEFGDAYAINNASQILADASGREYAVTGKACILLPTR